MNNQSTSRRSFIKTMGAAVAVAGMPFQQASAEKTRKVRIGHTGITWRNSDADQAIKDIGSLGFFGYETFGEVLQRKDTEGDLAQLLETNHVPLISGYCTINLTDSTKRADELTKTVNFARVIKKYGGRIFVLGPNQVHRDTYDYKASKDYIVGMCNEVAKSVAGEGLTAVLHQHTGTCVESRDETYATLDAVDTKVLKFGPDVGQLTKGGADAVKVVKDYLPIVQHMHLKDYNGKDDHLSGYCSLGQGTVNVPAILDMMERRKISGMVMGELDNDGRSPSGLTPEQLVKASRDYLVTLGVQFRKI